MDSTSPAQLRCGLKGDDVKTLNNLRLRLSRRTQDERGAYAVLASMTLVLVIALAAISVDIARQVESRQGLHDAMDAVAHAGAYAFGEGDATYAVQASRAAAAANGHSGALDITLWCVVGATEDGKVNTTHIPATCDPGFGAPYDSTKYPGLVCDEVRCFIPCLSEKPGFSGKCNTVRTEAERDVDYKFAPAIGHDQGSTGTVVSVACRGACGGGEPNPLNVVIMADRTASMEAKDRELMKTAILDSLKTMDPSMHHVAFGALHKSRTANWTSSSQFKRPDAPPRPSLEDCQRYKNNGRYETRQVWVPNWWGGGRWETQRVWVSDGSYEACQARNQQKGDEYDRRRAEWQAANDAVDQLASTAGWDGNGDTNGDGVCKTEATRTSNYRTSKGSVKSAADTRSEGTWIPVPLSNSYLREDGSLNPVSGLVDGVSCLGESASGEYGTHLAGALKGAANYLLGKPRVSGAEPRPENVQDVIIFQTDGQPDEVGDADGSTALGTSGDVFGGQQLQLSGNNRKASNGTRGCNNFLEVARAAKAKKMRIITVGFGGANTATCERYFDFNGEKRVRDVLAEAASPDLANRPATASACADNSQIRAENSDGDNYYCAATGDDLASVFTTALTSVTGGIKLLRMPS